ncbi:MAG TPA: guanylate kinase [Bacteroidia bacterium]|nr:guanylate kinase [Bacteroidia bacterium]
MTERLRTSYSTLISYLRAMESGKLVIFSAPSGAGKTTIVHHLLDTFPQLEFSVSATSRPLRGDEHHGADYYFLSVEEFKRRIEAGDFVEWEEVYPGQMYGTLHAEVERIWRKGHHVIFDVDVKGGINLAKKFGERALSVFVMPPSVEALEQRLRFRATEPEEKIRMRLAKAKRELDEAIHFDTVLLNDYLPDALARAEDLVKRFLQHA